MENAYRVLQEKFLLEKEQLEFTAMNKTADISSAISEEYDIEVRNATAVYSLSTFLNDYFTQHTAPQHRQYLSYDGVGHGSPFQRQKQYQKHQVKKAVENVYNHRLSHIENTDEQALMVHKDAKASRKTKTKYTF